MNKYECACLSLSLSLYLYLSISPARLSVYISWVSHTSSINRLQCHCTLQQNGVFFFCFCFFCSTTLHHSRTLIPNWPSDKEELATPVCRCLSSEHCRRCAQHRIPHCCRWSSATVVHKRVACLLHVHQNIPKVWAMDRYESSNCVWIGICTGTWSHKGKNVNGFCVEFCDFVCFDLRCVRRCV